MSLPREVRRRRNWCDEWDGLDSFFEAGRELIVARTTDDVIAAMQLPPDELASIAQAGRERVLSSHTAAHRAAELERIFADALRVSVVHDSTQRHMVVEV